MTKVNTCNALPVNYVEVKEKGKRKYQQVTVMAMSLENCIEYIKTCKTNALATYGKDFIYRITTIYDNGNSEVTMV